MRQANATWQRKQQITAEHTYFELGSLYYLSHDARVPEATREHYMQYGLCRHEFVNFGHMPPQVRALGQPLRLS